ncbi:hypothetical protein CBS101457_002153 [Exobasidium rhododendri]|nr:hypothetical protein CBS101457_002153 [Exobasidium rhododendri]
MLKRAFKYPQKLACQRRSLHNGISSSTSTSDANGRSIAVVGAGLAGLTLTLHLARHLSPSPKYRIVLYDADQRVGGWVRSDRLSVKGKDKEKKLGSEVDRAASALLEAGPRSIRPVGLPGFVMLDLIKSLGLSSELICVNKSHASAKNRFLYYAGKIHLLPSSIGKALRTMTLDRNHPLSKGKIPSTLFRGLFKPKEKRLKSDKWADESVESFLTRRMGKEGSSSLPLLDYVGSAVLHGIYAADASKLSVRSIFGFLWTANVIHGSPARAILPSFMNMQHKSLDKLANVEGDESARLELTKAQRLEKETKAARESLGEEFLREMEQISVVSFPDGIQTLTNAMRKECQERGVIIKTGASVEGIDLAEERVEVKTADGVERFDRVVSAIPSSTLEKLLQGTSLPNLTYNPSSTVAVLNLAIPASSAIEIPLGFGYLVPRACAKEGDNPMGLLGVVFDSVAVPGQDDCSKLTMMSGGPFWKKGFGVHDLLSTGQEAAFIDEALSLVAKHLSLDVNLLKDESTLKRLTLQKDCIVTYAPGHLGRMDQLDIALQHQKNLTVIGASYTGVSLNDCVLYATRTAKRIVASEMNEGKRAGVTGLEELVRE